MAGPAQGGPPDELGFVPIEARHLDALTELFRRNRDSAVGRTFDPFELSPEHATRIALEPRKDRYYAATHGVLLLAMSMLRGYEEGFVVPSFGVFVDARHQGEGIGRRLTKWTIEQAHLQGSPAVRLSVYSDNPRAHGLYESLGFHEQEREPVDRDGVAVEKIVMRLELAR
ncbi:MAG: GNAT family N-acetyltransferase [Solirubrobacterales bacterium]